MVSTGGRFQAGRSKQAKRADAIHRKPQHCAMSIRANGQLPALNSSFLLQPLPQTITCLRPTLVSSASSSLTPTILRYIHQSAPPRPPACIPLPLYLLPSLCNTFSFNSDSKYLLANSKLPAYFKYHLAFDSDAERAVL